MTYIGYPITGNVGDAITIASGGGGNSGGYAYTTPVAGSTVGTIQNGYQGVGMRFVSDGANALAVRYHFAGGGTATTGLFAVRFRVPPTPPTIQHQVFWQIADPSVVRIIQLQYRTDGTVRVFDRASNNFTLLTAGQATPGSWFRIEMAISNVSATTGSFVAKAYSTGNTQVGSTASSTTANLGAGPIANCSVGILNATDVQQDIDDVQMNDGVSSGTMGDYTVNSTPPSVSAGSNQTIANPGGTVTLTATATPATGSAGIASYAWTLVSAISITGATISGVTISGASGASPTFVPSTRGRYIFQVTATDREGNTSSASQVRIFVPGTTVTPIEVTASTGFLTTTVGNVTDTSDSTYAESGAAGSGTFVTYRLAPIAAGASSFALIVRSLVQAIGGTQKVELLQGSTVRKDWGGLAPNTTFTDQTLSLTSGEMATITSWNELDVRFTQV